MAQLPNFKVEEYRDFDFDFSVHPKTGDISKVKNINAIKQSVINLLNLRPYDKPYQPELFSRLLGLLFEPMSTMAAESMETVIREVIENNEPRVDVNQVNVEMRPMDHFYEVQLVLTVHNPDIQQLNIEMFLAQGT